MLAAEVRRAADKLLAAGVDSPRPDAEQLAAHVLGVPRGRLELASFDAGQLDRFRALVERRARREPLQHLIGSVGFRRLDLLVGPGVFVPRPETESVVQWAVEQLISALAGRRAPVVVDLCTGAGTIALSLAKEAPGAQVHGVDLDPAALAWARRNVERTGLPVTLHQCPVAEVAARLPELLGAVDLVASNPPYVALGERHQVDPEVLDHDPAVALWAGADGLDLVRSVEAAARRLLQPGGLVAVEHSDRQGRSAPAVFTAAGGWSEVADHRDLAGRDRFVTARWTGAR
jgi:release factor glutamine methyltransferase